MARAALLSQAGRLLCDSWCIIVAVMPEPPKGKTSPGDPLPRERANEKYDSFSRLVKLRHPSRRERIEIGAIYSATFFSVSLCAKYVSLFDPHNFCD